MADPVNTGKTILKPTKAGLPVDKPRVFISYRGGDEDRSWMGVPLVKPGKGRKSRKEVVGMVTVQTEGPAATAAAPSGVSVTHDAGKVVFQRQAAPVSVDSQPVGAVFGGQRLSGQPEHGLGFTTYDRMTQRFITTFKETRVTRSEAKKAAVMAARAYVEAYMDRNRVSALEVERRAKLPRGVVGSSLFTGHLPSYDRLRALAELCGVTVEQFTGAATNSDQQGRSIPVLATAGAAGKERVAETEHGYVRTVQIPRDLHVIEVTGDSMSPVVVSGQHVLVTNDRPDSGDLAVVELEDGELLFKRIQWEDGHLHLLSVNPDPSYKMLTLRRGQWRSLRRVWGAKY